jgi:hypothetical protein
LKSSRNKKKTKTTLWFEGQGVEEYRRRLEIDRFEEPEVEKIAAQLKEVIEKATTKQEIIVKGVKGKGRKNEWWDIECKYVIKEGSSKGVERMEEDQN